jgi:acetate kinase
MRVLTVNTGSASTKLALFEVSERGAKRLHSVSHPAGGDPADGLAAFMDESGGASPDAIAHRVVHGGAEMTGPRRIDADTAERIARLGEIAPLHNPIAHTWIEGCRRHFGNEMPQVAIFDTGFYAELPGRAARYALPNDLASRHGIRRYGFHGIAHGAMNTRWRDLRPDLRRGGRLISIQLGGGCSITATDEGRPLDTSMGFSPVEGLVMTSRSGDLDPSIVTYLMRRDGLSPDAMDDLLNHRSGLAGLAGGDGDMRALLRSDAPEAEHAIESYCYRARKYIGAYMAVLGGADGIVFGGGVGENATTIRARILSGMGWCGIALDRQINAAVQGREARLAAQGSKVDLWVIPVDEQSVLAREAFRMLSGGQ